MTDDTSRSCTMCVIVQLVGHKRVVLYPPSEAKYLYVEGSSSRVADVDNPDLEAFPLFAKATGRLETTLAPGNTQTMLC